MGDMAYVVNFFVAFRVPSHQSNPLYFSSGIPLFFRSELTNVLLDILRLVHQNFSPSCGFRGGSQDGDEDTMLQYIRPPFSSSRTAVQKQQYPPQ